MEIKNQTARLLSLYNPFLDFQPHTLYPQQSSADMIPSSSYPFIGQGTLCRSTSTITRANPSSFFSAPRHSLNTTQSLWAPPSMIHESDPSFPLEPAWCLPLSPRDKLEALNLKLPIVFKSPSIVTRRGPRPAFIFIDHSNVIWSFLRFINDHYPTLDLTTGRFARLATQQPHQHYQRKVRIDYRVLFAILERDPSQRAIVRKYIAASNPLYQPDMVEYWEQMGYETAILDPVVNRNPTTRRIHRPVHHSTTESDSDSRPSPTTTMMISPRISQRGTRYKEQAVDEVIQLNMLDTVMEFNWTGEHDPRPRPILTLVSGDANAGEYSKSGFAGWVGRCLEMGWDVEIVGFKKAISQRYLAEAERSRMIGLQEEGLRRGKGGRGRLEVFMLDGFAAELVADMA